MMREFLIFAAATIVLQASRFGVNLYSAKQLGPHVWSDWMVLNLALAYIGLFHLGLINAMNREVPFYRGREEEERVEEIESVTLGVVLLSGLSVAVLFLLGSAVTGDGTVRGALAALAPLLAVSLFSIYLQTSLKADQRFDRLSVQQLVFAGVLPLLVVPLVRSFGLTGFIGGQAIAVAVVAAGMTLLWKFNLKPRFDRREMVRLLRIGLPILGVGILYVLLTTADRFVIIALLGARPRLGYYSLAIMVVGIIGLIPMLVAQQTYPRMAESWGRNGRVEEVMAWVRRQVTMSVGITLPVVALVWLGAAPFVHRFLPGYVPGIEAMKIIVVGPLFLALAGGFGNLLNVLDRQVWYLAVQGGALLLNVGLNIILVKAGLGISGVALGTTITYALYGSVLVGVGLRVVRREIAASGGAGGT